MPDINSQFPSKYLRATDFDEDGAVLTIAALKREPIKNKAGADELRPILYFRGEEKGLVLNKTNANKLTKLFQSSDTDDWIDQPVCLFATEVQFGADMVQAIRIKQAAVPTKKQESRYKSRPGANPAPADDGSDPF